MYRKRLKNVYELLETGNNKKVVQEVDKLIASNPATNQKKQQQSNADNNGFDEKATFIIAKALKSLALVRLNRKPEGDLLINELLESNITDENALTIIMQYCKETQQLSKIVSFYENAANKFQQDPSMFNANEYEEILSSLFYAYVRNRDFEKQQQIALKLYKQTNKITYCFWNAASYVMMSNIDQYSSENERNHNMITITQLPKDLNQKQLMYLQLGEKILQKAYDEKKMEFNGEYLLLLNILEERNRFDDALKLINEFDEAKHQSKLGIIDLKIKKMLFYFKKLKRWQELNQLAETYLTTQTNSNLDNWLVYTDYFDSFIGLLNEKKLNYDNLDTILNDDLVKKTLEEINKLKERADQEAAKSNKIQAPYLAQIELYNKLFTLFMANKVELQKCKSALVDELKISFDDYLNRFACKPGVYNEIIYFKEIIINLDLQNHLLNTLKKLHDSNWPFKDVKSVYTCLAYWQMHRFLGKQNGLNHSQLNDLAVQLEKMYVDGLKFGKDLLPTSFQYADDFMIMAVHLRYEIYRKFTHNSSEDLLQIIFNLKQALIHSPSSYQFKLLLLNLYSQLGAYDSLHSMYTSMEIKNIQNYSIANFLIIHNLRLGSYTSSASTYSTMDSFFSSNLFDMVNFLVNCYKYGTFLKAIEISAFINAIKQSLTLNLCLTNFMTVKFIQHSITGSSSEGTTNLSEEDLFQNELKSLKSKVSKHLKEISNLSSIYDKENGLLPDDDDNLNKLIIDHHDKTILCRWDSDEIEEMANRQYDAVVCEQRKILKLRSLIVRFLDAYLKLNTSNDESDKEVSIDDTIVKLGLYKQKILDFDYKLKLSDRNFFNPDSDDSKLVIYNTKSSYLNAISELKLNTLMSVFVSLAVDLTQETAFLDREQVNGQKNLRDYQVLLTSSFETIKTKTLSMLSIFSSENEKKFRIEKIGSILECFSASAELASFVCNLISLFLTNKQNQLRQLWAEKTKKNKKKKSQYAQYMQTIDIIFDIIETFCTILNFFHSQLKQIVCPNVLKLTQDSLKNTRMIISTGLTENQANSGTFLNDIANSYLRSFEDLKHTFHQKIKSLLKLSGCSTTNLSQIMENLKL